MLLVIDFATAGTLGVLFLSGMLLGRWALRRWLPGAIDPLRETGENPGCMLFFAGACLFAGVLAGASNVAVGFATALLVAGGVLADRR